MKLYYIWSSGIEALHHLFQANHKYQDAFEIIDDKIVQLEGESVFKSNVWHNAVLQKTIRDYTALKKNPNKIMVFSDPDICIYDAEKLRLTNDAAANKYLDREYRKGWSPEDM
mgnify:CR=1 FL=1